MNVPGVRLLGFMARLLDPVDVRALVEPTIADLQHEVYVAGGTPWTVGAAYLRVFAALVRLLMQPGLVWRSPMRGVLAVVGLALVGAVALGAALAARLGRAAISRCSQNARSSA
jgi:hypothetical protein